MEQAPGLDNMIISATSAAYVVGILVNGFTLFNPERKSWQAFGIALVLGLLSTLVLTLATISSNIPLDRQLISQMVVVGILATGAAAGSSVTQASAQSKRERSQEANSRRAADPDPMTTEPGG